MSKTPEMDAIGVAIHRYLAFGEIPPSGLGEKFQDTWPLHHSRLNLGGSDNHSLIGAAADYMRNGTTGWGYLYLLGRGQYELIRELELRETNSGTYGSLHLGGWSSVAVASSRAAREESVTDGQPHARLHRIAREIVTRQVAMRSIMSTRVGTEIAVWSPGQRFDFGTTDPRLQEGAILGVLLGMKTKWDRVGTPVPPAVSILRGLRSVPDLSRIVRDQVLFNCRSVIGTDPGFAQRYIPKPLRDCLRLIRLAAPITYWTTTTGFAAAITKGTHGQDPAAGAVVVSQDRAEYLYPPVYLEVDPPEEGWSAQFEILRGADVVVKGLWRRAGKEFTDEIRFKPTGSHPDLDELVIGSGPPAETASLPPVVYLDPVPRRPPVEPPSVEPPAEESPAKEVPKISEIASRERVRGLSLSTKTAAIQALLAATGRELHPVTDPRLVKVTKRVLAELEQTDRES